MNGIAVAGTVLADRIHRIATFPKMGELAKIEAMSAAAGGCVPNVAIDLKVLRPDLPVYALGRIGADADGDFVAGKLASYGVDVSLLTRSEDERTSYTEVMSVTGGERTFFSYPGANASFAYDDVPFDRLGVGRLHLGYLLLLDRADRGDAAKILREAARRGIRTSIDLISAADGDYSSARECLPLADDLIVNEIEGAGLAGLPRETDPETVAGVLKDMGVRDRVIIHKPDFAVCKSGRGTVALPSLELPEGFVKGTTGAGDAFTAGALLAAEEGADDREILAFASAAAACALRTEDAVGGMRGETEVRNMEKLYGRKPLCW